jgi:hypothetical protein
VRKLLDEAELEKLLTAGIGDWLMAHGHATLPGTIHDLSFERLVRDPARGDPAAARVLRAGQDWEDSTPVRQPLYDSSLARWRHYARQLEGLRRQLVTADIEVES